MVQINIPMPETCKECRFLYRGVIVEMKFCYAEKSMINENVEEERPDWCPLVEVNEYAEEDDGK